MDTTQPECFGVVCAFMILLSSLQGAGFTLRMDHHATRWIVSLADTAGNLARWRLDLLKIRFQTVVRDGMKHQALNKISRLPTNGSIRTRVKEDRSNYVRHLIKQGRLELFEKVYHRLLSKRDKLNPMGWCRNVT